MKELWEVHQWLLKQNKNHHDILLAQTLPSPTFKMNHEEHISFSTNNYLALATSTRLIQAAKKGLEKYGVANCESRLLGGDLDIYRELEQKLADMKHKTGAMLFATGYLTNLGALSALVRSPLICRFYGFRPSQKFKYTYFSDELNHISIREGIRMSEAERVTYKHLDMNHLENCLKKSESHIKIIVSDGVFSQDGDIAPLPDLLKLAELYDAFVYIDDAHGTGVLGETGKGIAEYFKDQIAPHQPRMIHMGTLSKAYGSIGGFIAADKELIELLRFTTPAYGFTSTLPPDQAYAVSEAIDMVKDEPERREKLWSNQNLFVRLMKKNGFQLLSTQTPIVPILIGSEDESERISHELRENHFHVDSVQFPAVAKGKARLRFILNAGHTEEQIHKLTECMKSIHIPQS